MNHDVTLTFIFQEDADTFASWDIDYVKLDGCYSHPNDMDKGYPEFGYWLNQTGVRID